MTRLSAAVTLALALTLGGISASGEAAVIGPQAETATRLQLAIDPLVELYFHVRAQAADPAAHAEPGLEAAVDAARAIQGQLGSFGGWGPLDTRVLTVDDAAELVAGFSRLPEPYVRRGRSLSLRADAVRLAEALVDEMPAFLAVDWPARRAQLEARARFLETALLPKHQGALRYMMDSLGISDPEITVPMFLVTRTNPPGAMTYYLRGGRSASVVAVGTEVANELLMEIVLHEATHALDLSAEGSGAFDRLRALLTERGLSRRDGFYHDIPHTLMFVQAEETMRRFYDPDHVAYGDATDLYQRSGEMARVEREIWPRHLDGELSREEALRQIVETLDPRPAQ